MTLPTKARSAAARIGPKAPTRRTLAKQQTRLRVLAAARSLFSEVGYEAAAIRDIAAAAGMSTGAVFANFTDKSDLFREIMIADMTRKLEAMRAAAAEAKTTEDALVAAFAAGYAFYQDQLPLARAAFSLSWSSAHGEALRRIPPLRAMQDQVADHLRAGIARGELIDDQIDLRAQMLFDCYQANFPLAIFGGHGVEALNVKARAQICIILAGARAG